ncbi:MAG: dTMP kinase [Verrucomicrobia bacterium]|nr:dTMP kinase [Verrucomicrobiota bacterium]
MAERGIFVTLEGPEGSGKTTQARLLCDRLEAAGREVLYTREPGGTPTGEAIRNILQHDEAGEDICKETEVLLFAASRAQLVRHVILPALESGKCVICDRFADSTTAYQGFGRGFSVEQMLAINSFAIGPAIPDVTVLLDLDVSAGFTRLKERHEKNGQSPDRIEREAMEFHQRVRDGYLKLAERWPDRFRILNADRPVDLVSEDIWEIVGNVLGR